jgi:hypothetical protein
LNEPKGEGLIRKNRIERGFLRHEQVQ